MMYYYIVYSVSVLFLLFVWCTCMAINNVSVSYNGGLLPDIILLISTTTTIFNCLILN